jgi:peptide/nickel transport system permease protein
MTNYLVRRLTGGVAVLFGLLIFAFLATHYIGDPVALIADPEFVTPEEAEQLRIAGGYDRPVWEQLGDFMGGAIQGDFGDSVYQNKPARDIVLERVPRTLQLGAVTLLVTFIVAVPLAIFSARRHGRPSNLAITGLTTLGASLPGFFVALTLIYIFAVQLGWLPTSGYGWWPEMVLPVIALSLASIARYTQVLEQSIVKEFQRPYVSTARSKGLKEGIVVRRHVLRNAGLVSITLISAEIITLLNGAVLIEQIFAWPGVGRVLLEAVTGRDLPVVMAGVVYIGVIVVVINILVDLLYAWVDPRVRLA